MKSEKGRVKSEEGRGKREEGKVNGEVFAIAKVKLQAVKFVLTHK